MSRPWFRLALAVSAAAVLATGCSGGDAPPSPAPGAAAPTSTAPTSAAAAPPPTDTRTLTPARRLFSVSVPDRFVDLPADSPEAAAVAPLAQAMRGGAGVLAVDRTSAQSSGSGYSPTAGGFCTRTPSQDLPQLAEELRAGAVRTGTTTAPPRVEVLPTPEPTAGPRVVVSYPAAFSGRPLDVTQVAGLAGPGRACVLTLSTDDPNRDAAAVRTVRDTFRMAG